MQLVIRAITETALEKGTALSAYEAIKALEALKPLGEVDTRLVEGSVSGLKEIIAEPRVLVGIYSHLNGCTKTPENHGKPWSR